MGDIDVLSEIAVSICPNLAHSVLVQSRLKGPVNQAGGQTQPDLYQAIQISSQLVCYNLNCL